MSKKRIQKIGIDFTEGEMKGIDAYLNEFIEAYDQYLETIDINLDMVPSDNFGNNNIVQSSDLLNDEIEHTESLEEEYLFKNSRNYKNGFFVLKK